MKALAAGSKTGVMTGRRVGVKEAAAMLSIAVCLCLALSGCSAGAKPEVDADGYAPVKGERISFTVKPEWRKKEGNGWTTYYLDDSSNGLPSFRVKEGTTTAVAPTYEEQVSQLRKIFVSDGQFTFSNLEEGEFDGHGKITADVVSRTGQGTAAGKEMVFYTSADTYAHFIFLVPDTERKTYQGSIARLFSSVTPLGE